MNNNKMLVSVEDSFFNVAKSVASSRLLWLAGGVFFYYNPTFALRSIPTIATYYREIGCASTAFVVGREVCHVSNEILTSYNYAKSFATYSFEMTEREHDDFVMVSKKIK